MKLVVIDYGLCNLRSVFNACKHMGVDAIVSSNPIDLKSADAAILPGVGAFEDGMKGLSEKGFVEPIREFTATGKPFLGICLGMQMLMTKSYEFGEHQGLGLIPGEVAGFKNHLEMGEYDFKVPHIGWNGLFDGTGGGWEETILAGLDQGEEAYFVHSFFVNPADKKCVLGKTPYGGLEFCSVVKCDNVMGCQFHPEKSAKSGLRILENFINLN